MTSFYSSFEHRCAHFVRIFDAFPQARATSFINSPLLSYRAVGTTKPTGQTSEILLLHVFNETRQSAIHCGLLTPFDCIVGSSVTEVRRRNMIVGMHLLFFLC